MLEAARVVKELIQRVVQLAYIDHRPLVLGIVFLQCAHHLPMLVGQVQTFTTCGFLSLLARPVGGGLGKIGAVPGFVTGAYKILSGNHGFLLPSL